jgi:hypothetical protein
VPIRGIAGDDLDPHAVLQAFPRRGAKAVDHVRITMELELDLQEIGQVVQIGMDDAAVLAEMDLGTAGEEHAGHGPRWELALARAVPFNVTTCQERAELLNLSHVAPLRNRIERLAERHGCRRPGISETVVALNLDVIEQPLRRFFDAREVLMVLGWAILLVHAVLSP